jgi:hypothetical protein
VKRSFQNFQVSEVQIPQSNIVNFKRVRQDRNQKNFVLQKIHTFFTKIDALNIEYISRRW